MASLESADKTDFIIAYFTIYITNRNLGKCLRKLLLHKDIDKVSSHASLVNDLIPQIRWMASLESADKTDFIIAYFTIYITNRNLGKCLRKLLLHKDIDKVSSHASLVNDLIPQIKWMVSLESADKTDSTIAYFTIY